MHAPIHFNYAPRLDEDDETKDNEVVSFIDKHISRQYLMKNST